ncbi:MAG: AsmA-like C-terminal region-containing protein, partial [Gammaproteobacteria bacterium]
GFNLSLSTSGLNLQKALTAVKAKAANTVRGLLTGNLKITGHGRNFARVRPTLRGNGKAQVIDAKLLGVNVAAQALRKIDHLPAIGALVPGGVIANHPELFKSPDTDIQSASLTFVIFGARLSTNDFFAQAIDYSATASGWFNFDKYLDMNVQIFLSQPFSSDLIAARQNDAFLADRGGQIIIPLRITGRLPHPQVLPNIDILAQRAATHALQNNVGSLIDKGGHGLGRLFKHGNNPLKNLFH